MEDENKILQNIKKIKIILIIIIITIIAIIIAYIAINRFLINSNTTNFTDYLAENGYTQGEDGNYTKQIVDGSTVTDYSFYPNDFILSKSITKTLEKYTTIITLTYTNDNTIDITYNIQGINNSGSYSTGLQKATYDTEKSDYSCEIVLANNFDAQCNLLQQEAIEFKNEVEDILEHSNSNAKYIE